MRLCGAHERKSPMPMGRYGTRGDFRGEKRTQGKPTFHLGHALYLTQMAHALRRPALGERSRSANGDALSTDSVMYPQPGDRADPGHHIDASRTRAGRRHRPPRCAGTAQTALSADRRALSAAEPLRRHADLLSRQAGEDVQEHWVHDGALAYRTKGVLRVAFGSGRAQSSTT